MVVRPPPPRDQSGEDVRERDPRHQGALDLGIGLVVARRAPARRRSRRRRRPRRRSAASAGAPGRPHRCRSPARCPRPSWPSRSSRGEHTGRAGSHGERSGSSVRTTSVEGAEVRPRAAISGRVEPRRQEVGLGVVEQEQPEAGRDDAAEEGRRPQGRQGGCQELLSSIRNREAPRPAGTSLTGMDISTEPRSRAQRRRDTEHRLTHDVDRLGGQRLGGRCAVPGAAVLRLGRRGAAAGHADGQPDRPEPRRHPDRPARRWATPATCR